MKQIQVNLNEDVAKKRRVMLKNNNLNSMVVTNSITNNQ